jgi:hypothetical protein
LLQCAGPPRRRRPRRTSRADLRLAVTGNQRPTANCSTRRRSALACSANWASRRRPRRDRPANDHRGDHRDARVCPAGCRAFGGIWRIRRTRTRGAHNDARPAVVVSAFCGIEATRTVDYKPMLDAALGLVHSNAWFPARCRRFSKLLMVVWDRHRDAAHHHRGDAVAVASAGPHAGSGSSSPDPPPPGRNMPHTLQIHARSVGVPTGAVTVFAPLHTVKPASTFQRG